MTHAVAFINRTHPTTGHSFTFRPDGWFNMTSAAKQFGKRLDNFVAAKETEAYIGALMDSLSLNSRDKVLVATRGDGRLATTGTWAHPKLAVFFARWLDVRFSVWCDSVIDELLRGKAAVVPARPTPAPAPVDDHRKACLDEFKAQTQLLQGLYAVARSQAADISRLLHEVNGVKKHRASAPAQPLRPLGAAPAPTSNRLDAVMTVAAWCALNGVSLPGPMRGALSNRMRARCRAMGIQPVYEAISTRGRTESLVKYPAVVIATVIREATAA